MYKRMKPIILLSIIFFSANTYASECSDKERNLVKQLVEGNKLVELSEKIEAKLWKFTHADYPDWCQTSYEGTVYKIHSASWNTSIIVQKVLSTQNRFYSLFKKDI